PGRTGCNSCKPGGSYESFRQPPERAEDSDSNVSSSGCGRDSPDAHTSVLYYKFRSAPLRQSPFNKSLKSIAWEIRGLTGQSLFFMNTGQNRKIGIDPSDPEFPLTRISHARIGRYFQEY